jgi:hypothetical protein
MSDLSVTAKVQFSGTMFDAAAIFTYIQQNSRAGSPKFLIMARLASLHM